MHTDKYNLSGTTNAVITFGKHAGGEIWMDERFCPQGGRLGPWSERRLPNGSLAPGQLVSPFESMVTFDAHYHHQIEPWQGERLSLAAWTNQAVHKIDNRCRRTLKTLGFSPPRKTSMMRPNVTYFHQKELCDCLFEFCAGVSGSTIEPTHSSFPTEQDDEEDDLESGPVGPPAEPDLQLTESQKRMIHKVHVNVGHPPRARFLRMMKAAGALPHVLRYIRDQYECEQCSIRQRPDHRHRARCPRVFEFNRMLSIDVFYIKFGQYQVPILNMTD